MDTSFHPLVSIIIPVYNGSNYMQEAIDSALAQTYKNIEIIVVNDGSNDNGETERIALSYGDKIKYYHKENGGVSSALNLGIQNMQGEYFSWLSHDDKYDENKIKAQIDQLANYSEDKKLIALGRCKYINELSDKIPHYNRIHFLDGDVIEPKAVLKSLFKNGCFCGCALLLPKEAFDIAGYFDEDLRFCQDYLMWIKVFLNDYSLIYCTESCTYNRIHKKQLTRNGQDIFHKDSKKISDVVLQDVAKISTSNDNLLYEFALNNAKYDNQYAVKKCFEAANEVQLFDVKHKIKIRIFCLYGKIRPFVRKTYYHIAKLSLFCKTRGAT